MYDDTEWFNDLLPTKFFMGFVCGSVNSCCITYPSWTEFDWDFLQLFYNKTWNVSKWMYWSERTLKNVDKKITFPETFSNAATISSTDMPFPFPRLYAIQPIRRYMIETQRCNTNCYQNHRLIPLIRKRLY